MDRLSEKMADVLRETIDALSQVEEDIIKAAVDRLAAYEATGYSPEDFDKLCREMSDLRTELALPTYERLRAVIQEGRLLVLPCKVGDTVYRVFAPDGREPVISAHTLMSVEYIVRWIGKFGKTVFLTHEDAEAALKKGGRSDG